MPFADSVDWQTLSVCLHVTLLGKHVGTVIMALSCTAQQQHVGVGAFGVLPDGVISNYFLASRCMGFG